MTISYPLSLPSSPGFVTCRITPRHTAGMTESPFTYQQQVYDWMAGRWEAELSLPKMKRAAAEEWICTFLALKGRKGTFLLGDPDAATPRGVATGTPLVNGAHSARGETLAIKGFTAGVTGILLAGDYLQIGTSTATRLYKNLSDVDSDGSGNATLDIWPPLREALSDGAAITLSSAKGCFRLTAPVPWDTDHVSLYGITFAAIEAL